MVISDVSFKLYSLFTLARCTLDKYSATLSTEDKHSIINILLTQLKLVINDSFKAIFYKILQLYNHVSVSA